MAQVFRPDIVAAVDAAEQSGGLAVNGMAVLKRLEEQRDAKRGVHLQLFAPVLYLLFAAALIRRLRAARVAGFRAGSTP